MSYINIWEEGGVYRKYTNFITGGEILQSIQDVHGSPDFDSISYVINDLLDITEYDISNNDIKTIVAIDKASALSNPNIKIAVVAAMPSIQNLTSLYSELINNTPFSCNVFSTIDEAREWAT